MIGLKTEMKTILEQLIGNGIRVIIFNLDDKDLYNLICDGIQSRNMNSIEVWHCINEATSFNGTRLLAREQMDRILRLYHLYEFSDKITVLSEDIQFANMINYVKVGLLTPEEMVEALLVN